MTTLERAQAKHKAAANDVLKLADKRDRALDALIKAETRYRTAIKAVGRSQKRLDKARKEERQARAAGKAATAESCKELPSIAAAIGV